MSSAAARAALPRPVARTAARPAARPTGRLPVRPGGAARPSAPGRSGTSRRPPTLRVLPTPRRRLARAPFVGVVVALLAAGLLGLLTLNTVLAQGSFRLHALQVEAKQLGDREQVVRAEVDALQAPGALGARAQAMGMVPGGPPVFLRLPDGVVLGNAAPAPPAPAEAAAPGRTGGEARTDGVGDRPNAPNAPNAPAASTAATAPAAR